MKTIKHLILFFAFIINYNTFSQQLQNQWIWIDGSKNANEKIAEFGLEGIEDSNNSPYFRTQAAGITDNNGNLLLFGGLIASLGATNELWSYNPTSNNWTFKKGSIIKYTLGLKYSKGVGIEHYRNKPNVRYNTQSWKDNTGNLWVFSGSFNYFNQIPVNDLWKYNTVTNNWTEVYEGIQNPDGNYGTLGVESTTNVPPATSYATTWTDANGNLWMFGGQRPNLNQDDSAGWDSYNSLWKLNIVTGKWVWVSGSSTTNQFGSYGIQGTESPLNHPGARSNSKSWVDSQGNFWIFGGMGPISVTINGDANSAHNFNDLWKFNPITNLWTWVKGSAQSIENIVTVNTENSNNLPFGIGEYGAYSWKDNQGNFWYFDGSSDNRMWMYNSLTNNWILKKQINTIEPVYGTLGVSNINNTPGRRNFGTTWTSSNGELYLYSGRYMSNNGRNDLWKFNTINNSWTWVKGTTSIVNSYERLKLTGIADDEVNPGYLQNYCTKWNDSEGNLWVYGINGEGYDGGSDYNDLWKYNSTTKKWQWINGLFDYPRSSTYYDTNGQMGVEDFKNNPLSRSGSMSWVDTNDNLWLFGGTQSYWYNDMWKYNKITNKWVWVNGSILTNQPGNYGQQGVMSPTNSPGARQNGVTWVDNTGNFWLFGGMGFDSTGTANKLNDLWKYDVTANKWIWVKGSNIVNQPEVSAGIGVADTNNTPPASEILLSWKDNTGAFWLYTNGALWKFNNNYWTKVKVTTTLNYGTIGVFNTTNSPGFRKNSATWVDTDGSLLLFGHDSYDKYQDLWKYDIASNNWAWIGGKKYNSFSSNLPFANYGQINETFISNLPGGRSKSVSWKDNNGNLYLYGGNGWDENSEGNLSEIWISNRNINAISGNIKFNTNNNNCLNSTVNVVNANIKIVNNGNQKTTFTDNSGNFKEITEYNSVTVTPSLPYFIFNPTNQIVNFSGYGTTQNVNFCASATGVYNDLEITIIPVTQARPGFDSKYKVVYKNKGTTILSGAIQFNYSDFTLDYISASVAPSTQSTGVLNWNFLNLSPFESRSINVTMNCNSPMETPPLNGGDTLNYTATINAANDETPNDNIFALSQGVVNAFDPNDKTCLEGDVISPAKVGEYINYIIRFENTGNADATNIIVRDAIDLSKFEIATIQPVDASHAYRLVISDTNKLEFIFENIYLPFPSSTLRYGYIVFKIKTKSTLVVGDSFSNTANIYFDYNSPIVTNNFTTYIQTLSTDDFENLKADFIIYPNPVKNDLFFKTDETVIKVEIYDVSGKILSSLRVDNNKVNVSDLKSNVYFLKIYTANEVIKTKIIKE